MSIPRNVELKKGLKDVYFERTESSLIDGKEGKLLYRGYNIHDLAEHSTFEETVFLLLEGSLPTQVELNKTDSELRKARQVPDAILQLISLIKTSHPMDVLRTVVSAMSSLDDDVENNSEDSVKRKGIRMTAVVPTVIAAHHRIRQGDEPILPREDLAHAANFLYMLFGNEPDPFDAKLIDKDLILHAEHGVNASTFAARVASSTKVDFYSAITAAVATLKGPLHGGAAEGVMRMSQEIGTRENAEPYVKELRSRGGRVMGFGHAVYKAVDPRSVHLKSEAKTLGDRKGQPEWFSILDAVTKVMEPYARRGLNPNVDFWAGAIYYLLRIPEDLFIPLFAMGRVPGWVTHILEQNSVKDLLRPRLDYVGPSDLKYVPISDR